MSVWSEQEQKAWAPSEKMKPSKWAEGYRVLQPGQSNQSGPWRNANAPYLKGIMDIPCTRGVVQANVMKAGQIGVSEALRNVTGYWAHLDPDPMGLGLPNKDKGRKIVRQRLIPMFKSTDVLGDLMSGRAWDLKSESIKLINGFLMHLMWAGSPASTASDPMRRVINDEVDKPGFRDWGGSEPNPIGRTWTRLRTFGDRKLQINVSTPTNRNANINTLYEESSIKLVFKVPCPYCGQFIRLMFENLKYEKPKQELSKAESKELADSIVANSNVWYQCQECGESISPKQKPSIVRQGRWDSMNGRITDAENIDEWPRGTRVGMRISAMYCLWESWADIAAEWIRARGDRGKTYSFRTETLGLPWEEQIEKPHASLYSRKSQQADMDPGVVPEWAGKLCATVDTQKDHFYVLLRAWGPEMTSRRVLHCQVDAFDQLDALLFKHPWPNENNLLPAKRPDITLIDSGGTQSEGQQESRTMQVYRWVTKRRDLNVRAIKGAGKQRRTRSGQMFWPGKGKMSTGRGGKKDVRIWFVDPGVCADEMHWLANCGIGDDSDEDEKWFLNSDDCAEYNQHMANMHKVTIQNGSNLEEKWVPVNEGIRHDYWDTEVYQIAAAYMEQVHTLPDWPEWRRMIQSRLSALEEEQKIQQTQKEKGQGSGPKQKSSDAWSVADYSNYL